MPRGPFPKAIPWYSFHCCSGGDNVTCADLLSHKEHCNNQFSPAKQQRKQSRHTRQWPMQWDGLQGPFCPLLVSLEEGYRWEEDVEPPADTSATGPAQVCSATLWCSPCAPEKHLHCKLGDRHQAHQFPDLETEGGNRNERRRAETEVTAPGGMRKGASVHRHQQMGVKTLKTCLTPPAFCERAWCKHLSF